jgi:oxaloacetate decarboxylase alpha subunit
MTPFAQMLMTMAVMNVTGKERYGVIPDEVIRYALGRFGHPNMPIDPQVMDRIMSLPRTREIEAEPPPVGVADLRRKLGAQLSDEELLLRATMPANLVDAMQAAGAAPREYDPALRPVLKLIQELCARRDLAEVIVAKPGFRLRLSGGGV